MWKPQLYIIPLFVFHDIFSMPAAQNCIVKPPCTCSGSTVLCSKLNLTEVPEFDITDQEFDTLLIRLDDNFITGIHSFAFSNLTKTNCSDIRINLSGNELESMHESAFADVEDSITDLQLQANNLTALPTALTSLKRLNSLSVYGNNIYYFEPAIMQSLGLSLVTFRVGIKNKTWPSSFRFLFELHTLTLNDVELVSIPFDAFLGFESMLTSLQIEFSNLYIMPTALCTLNKLLALSFSFNGNLVDKQHIFPMCCPGLSAVRTLVISYNDLTGFPAVFNTFPNVTTLRLTHNPKLTYIDRSLVINDSGLTFLDLSSNGFSQIPEAFECFKNLQRLDLSNNSITTLESHNLSNTSSLIWLNLAENPLAYIADTAFRFMSRLEILKLDNVKLETLPKAVVGLPKLNYISLKSDQILCSCKMKWILTDWKRRTEVNIEGKCLGLGLNIRDYITTYLPQCP